MNTQRAAEIQVVLEGIRLPATRDELVAYARKWDPAAASEVAALPDRSYDRIDLVGEMLLEVQPPKAASQPHRPRDESGPPPGGEAYVDPGTEHEAVQLSAPPDNPPQKAIENASKSVKRQAAVQGS